MCDFNFDVERLKQAIDSPVIEIPPEIVTVEQFQEWLTKIGKEEQV